MILPCADAVLRLVRSGASGKISPEFAGICRNQPGQPEFVGVGQNRKELLHRGYRGGEKTANPAGAGFGKKQGAFVRLVRHRPDIRPNVIQASFGLLANFWQTSGRLQAYIGHTFIYRAGALLHSALPYVPPYAVRCYASFSSERNLRERRNTTTLRGGRVMVSSVWGLRPLRAFLS